MKILYPHGEATPEEIEEILRFAIEGRKRVKDQILRIDSTMAEVKFGYLDTGGAWHPVSTLEEHEYPAYYHRQGAETPDDGGEPTPGGSASTAEENTPEPSRAEPPLFEGHIEIPGEPAWRLVRTRSSSRTCAARADHDHRPLHPPVPSGPQPDGTIEGIASAKDPADEVNVKLITAENTRAKEKLRKQLETC